MSAIVCYARCWACQFGQHYDPPKVHTWMDDEDRAHAIATGQIAAELDVDKERPCACRCAERPEGSDR